MKEYEAKDKVCPFSLQPVAHKIGYVQYNDLNMTTDVPTDIVSSIPTRCLVTECMAWQKDISFLADPEDGYCKLLEEK